MFTLLAGVSPFEMRLQHRRCSLKRAKLQTPCLPSASVTHQTNAFSKHAKLLLASSPRPLCYSISNGERWDYSLTCLPEGGSRRSPASPHHPHRPCERRDSSQPAHAQHHDFGASAQCCWRRVDFLSLYGRSGDRGCSSLVGLVAPRRPLASSVRQARLVQTVQSNGTPNMETVRFSLDTGVSDHHPGLTPCWFGNCRLRPTYIPSKHHPSILTSTLQLPSSS